MIASTAIKVRYEERAAYAPTLQKIVREILGPYCAECHFGFHDRIKTLESVAEKLETGRVESWTELDDLYAATIVVKLIRFRGLPTTREALERVYGNEREEAGDEAPPAQP